MRFYTKQHKYSCGIDLHARSLYVCIVNHAGDIVVHRHLNTSPDEFLRVIAPYRDDGVVAVECLFTWYWLADLCAPEGMPFVLGHALSRKAIHGGKSKNDQLASQKIATLLRGGVLPTAYVYPQDRRAPRDLFRRRMYLMRRRSALLTPLQNTHSQYHLPAFGKKIASKTNRAGVATRFPDPSAPKTIEVDLELLECSDRLLPNRDLDIVNTATQHHSHHCALLRTIPGGGKLLAVVLWDEIHDITRFPRVQAFASSARFVKCPRVSAGKKPGPGHNKMGNVHRTWAFSEAACFLLRNNDLGQK